MAPLLRWFALAAIICSILSCGANLATESPTPPGGPIKPSSIAADELENNVRNQLYDPGKRDVRLTVSSLQITSYMALRYRNLSLENPQVWFAQDRAFLRGSYTGLCLFHPDVLIVATPTVKDKKILVDVQQVTIGSFALPQEWLSTVSKSFSDTIGEAQLNLDFDQVQVWDGELLITGSKRPG